LLAEVIRFINDILLSAPSIVVGLFVYTVVVAQMEHFSGWAGVIALALLQVPIVIRTTENMLKLVPDSLREAAYALGTPKWKMISGIFLQRDGNQRRDNDQQDRKQRGPCRYALPSCLLPIDRHSPSRKAGVL
jgi:ABC-type methionine transport system permease subunit